MGGVTASRPSATVPRTPGRRLLTLVGRRAVTWGLVGLVTVFGEHHVAAAVAPGLLEALNLGRYPPDTRPPQFSGLTLQGQTVSLAGLRGRVVVLNFWATWCLECRSEMPALEQLHRDYAAQGLTVVGLNVREGSEAIRKYAKEMGLTFPLVLDLNGKIQGRYGAIGLPTTFLIGRDGRAVALAIGPRDWASPPARAIIETLLAEPVVGQRAR